jgi:hypothetical protein
MKLLPHTVTDSETQTETLSLSGNWSNKATNETSGFFSVTLLLDTSRCVSLNVFCSVGILAKYHRRNLISSFPNRFFKQAKRSFSWLGFLHDFICFASLIHEIRFCPCLTWNTSCTRVRSSISEKVRHFESMKHDFGSKRFLSFNLGNICNTKS